MRRYGKQTDLSRGLSSLAGSLNRQSKGAFLQVRVADEWDKVAGPGVAEHTTGVHLRSGELLVHVDSPAWATELTALIGPYTEAMNSALGQNFVKTMRFTVSRKVDDKRRRLRQQQDADDFYAPDPAEPVPLTEDELRQVEASVPDVGDESLRQAAIRATIAGLELEKGRRRANAPQDARDAL